MPYELPALRLEGNTLFIDNSRMECFMRCPRQGEYYIVRRRAKGFNAALFCGEVSHLCLKYRYLYYPLNIPVPPECTYKQHKIIDMCYENIQLGIDEYRTSSYVKQLISSYNKARPTEEFSIIDLNGEPLVERSFSVYLGEINGVNIVWIGRIDLAIQDLESRIWVVDHKTSQIAGDYFVLDYVNSSQMLGYTFALRQVLEQPLMGVMLNALITRKITKTGKGVEFFRYRLEYSPETIDAWQENTLHLASDFLHCHHRGFFPMHTSQCTTKYGPCPYLEVCQLGPSSRLQWLYSGAYEDDTWSPLHKDRIDLAQLYQEPLPQGWEKTVESISQLKDKQEIAVNELIADVIKQATKV